LNIYYVNGEFVERDKAAIPIDDLAVLRGCGACDVMRTYNGKPYLLKEHIKRLRRSAKEIGLLVPWSSNDIERIIFETLKINKLTREATIRTIITGGSSTDFCMPQGKSRLLVLITKIPEFPRQWYEKGVKIITISAQRDIPSAKSISYIPATLALKKAHTQKAVEALYVNKDNFVTECTTSNLFAFIKDSLVTPEKDVLNGITRQVILSITEKKFKIEKRQIHLHELLMADEIFITGTNKGIVPVVKINKTVINTGRVGERTKKVIKILSNYVLDFK